VALKNERNNFRAQFIGKIKKSLPPNCIYSEPNTAPPGVFDKYVLFIPYISISLMEYEGYINVRTAMKIRLYDNAKDAYSGDIGHPNRMKPAAQSGGFRPVVPGDSGHPVGAERRWG
jgi:hypothetical protein